MPAPPQNVRAVKAPGPGRLLRSKTGVQKLVVTKSKCRFAGLLAFAV
jgi:hypothetical protein